MSVLHLSFLGTPLVQLDGQDIRFEQRKGLALLAYLAITGQRHQRESLMTLLWPDNDQARGKANLRHVIWMLNKILGKGWLISDRESVQLSEEVVLDTAVFLEQTKLGTTSNNLMHLDEAVSLYRGTFLAGFTLADTPSFDAWQTQQTQFFSEQFSKALHYLIERYGQMKAWELAINYARRWLALEPLNEAGHRALMLLLARSGQYEAALAHYETCQHLLEDELGILPETETVNLYETLQTANAVTRTSLPAPTTSFVGRQAELSLIQERLPQTECRLLTLVGLGGSGKTRLAIQAAHEMVSLFLHGVHFVPLMHITAASNIASAIAEVLQLQLRGNTPVIEQLNQYLHNKEMLLLLDNCEHLLK